MRYYQGLIGTGKLGVDFAAYRHHHSYLALLVLVQEFARCAVPLFIFLTGHFLAHAPHTWKAIWRRSRPLLTAYLLWSLLAWITTALLGGQSLAGCLEELVRDPRPFLKLLAIGQAQMGFYFILLIIQFFVLARWAVPLMRSRPGLVLWAGLLVQAASVAWNYGDLFLCPPYLGQKIAVPGLLFSHWTLFFALGLWVGLHPGRIKRLLAQRSGIILLLSLLAALSLVAESRLFLQLFEERARNTTLFTTHFMDPMVAWKVGTNLWALGLILGGLVLGRLWLPPSDFLVRLGTWAITIFLVHVQILLLLWGLVLKETWFQALFLPWWLVLPFLLAVSLALPILLARLLRHLAPRAARYVTGN
jgi:surface polysaccharide O-acyltransferase-like enzyme